MVEDNADLVPAGQAGLDTPRLDYDGVIQHFLSGLKPNTLRTYDQAFTDFVSFLSRREGRKVTRQDAAHLLLAHGHGQANITAHDYLVDMQGRGLSASSINNRLSAIRKLVAVARVRGLVPWSLEIRNVPSEPYRDTRGPGTNAVQLLLSQVAGSRPRDVRDRAIIRLLFDLSLRRGEVVTLDVEDVELERKAIHVLRKGKTEKKLLDLPPQTVKTLSDWLQVRGEEAGPLFINFDRAGKGERLSGTSLYRNLKKLGARIGVTVSPHQLRHTGITTASVKAAQAGYRQRDLAQYSGHKSSTTLDYYIDATENLQGKIADMVASTVEG
jgi:integrase/recombinase XerC